MGSQHVVIPGHLVPALNGQRPIGTAAATLSLHLSIGLAYRNASVLTALLKAQDDPHSQLFHRYLTAPQFAAQFGPLPSTTQLVTTYLRSQGMQITSVSSNHALIFADATASQAEQAFTPHLALFAYHGRTVYAPTTEPTVPTTLAGIVQGIVGLDDVAQIHRTPERTLPLHQIATKPPRDPNPCTPNGYGPGDLYTAYNLTPLVYNGYNGAGQNIAIVEFDGNNPADVDLFDNCFALPTLVSHTITLFGGPTVTVAGIAESDLDMEVLHEIAPGAQQIVYLSPASSSYTVQAFDAVVNDTTYAPRIVSTSYDEGCENTIGLQAINQLDNVFAQGAAQGMAFFNASGDNGAECFSGPNTLSPGIGVPESDPHVIAVGGTTYISGQPEVAWVYVNSQTGTTDSSGGGESTVFPTPAFQLGLSNYSKYHVYL